MGHLRLDQFSPTRIRYRSNLRKTIYRAESLPFLVTLLRSAYLDITPNCQSDKGNDLTREPGLCLVAAKAVYFGVDGGESNVIDAVEGNGGRKLGMAVGTGQLMYLSRK